MIYIYIYIYIYAGISILHANEISLELALVWVYKQHSTVIFLGSALNHSCKYTNLPNVEYSIKTRFKTKFTIKKTGAN